MFLRYFKGTSNSGLWLNIHIPINSGGSSECYFWRSSFWYIVLCSLEVWCSHITYFGQQNMSGSDMYHFWVLSFKSCSEIGYSPPDQEINISGGENAISFVPKWGCYRRESLSHLTWTWSVNAKRITVFYSFIKIYFTDHKIKSVVFSLFRTVQPS